MRFLLAFILSLLFIISPSLAQPKNGNNHHLNNIAWQKNGIVVNDSQGRSIRQNSKVANLEDGTSVIVWEDGRNGFTDIYAQKLNNNGTKLWGDVGKVVSSGGKNRTFPQIINAGNSEVIIAWQDYRNEYSDIYAQKLDINGKPVWDENGVPVCKAAANQLAVQLASDGAGGAVLTWYDYRSGKGEDIYAQKISTSGSIEWQLDGVPVCIEPTTQWYPQIMNDGSGGIIICWDDKRSGYYDIYAQKLDLNGMPVWQNGGIPVSAAPENQQYCQMAPFGKDSIVVTWQDYRNGNADIYAQKLDLSGRIAWKLNGEAVCNVAGNQEKPIVIGGERPIIIWTDFRNGTGNSDIFAQKISPTGQPLWNTYGLAVCEASGNQFNAKAVSDHDEGAFIAWEDRRSPTSGIFARRINKDGKALWAPDGKTVCDTSNSAEFPQVSSGDGNLIIVWQDKRHGNLDLYAQNINSSGVNAWKSNGINIVFAFGSVTQQKPRISKLGKGEYVIAFEDYRNGYSNIYCQKINNKGRLLWGVEGIRACNFDSDQLNPEIMSEANGESIIVWEDSRFGVSKVFAQKLDAYGNKIWDENGILICQTEGEKIGPKITRDNKGGAIIAWQDSKSKDGPYKIYAQRIDKNGSLLWKEDGILLTKSEGEQTNLKIDSDSENGAIITWVEYKFKGNISKPDIYAQRLQSDGAILWGIDGLPVCRAPEAQRNPEMAAGEKSEELIIVWEDSGSGNYDIYAQKINRDGTIKWTNDGIPICTASYTQHEPKLIQSDDNGAIITWEDYRNANWDIFVQRVDTNGELMWEKDGVPVCLSNGTQYAPQIVKSKDTSSIIVWEDYRNNKSYNIYAQYLNKSGSLLWDKEGVPVCSTDGGARSPQIVGDDEGGAVVIWTDYRFGSYDIYAQRLNENPGK